jgi:hypothetical protein
VSSICIALLLAVSSVCALVAWLSWLRLARYVYDKSGAEGLKALPPIAAAFRIRVLGLLPPNLRRQLADTGLSPEDQANS